MRGHAGGRCGLAQPPQIVERQAQRQRGERQNNRLQDHDGSHYGGFQARQTPVGGQAPDSVRGRASNRLAVSPGT